MCLAIDLTVRESYLKLPAFHAIISRLPGCRDDINTRYRRRTLTLHLYQAIGYALDASPGGIPGDYVLTKALSNRCL